MLNKKTGLLFSLIVIVMASQAQRYTIRGYVRDKRTGETLQGATVSIPTAEKMLNSNNYGFYSITLNKGTYKLICSFVGYNPFEEDILLDKDTALNILMEKTAVTAEEVVITARKKEDNIKSSQLGRISLSIGQIRSMPALMGEVDIIQIGRAHV